MMVKMKRYGERKQTKCTRNKIKVLRCTYHVRNEIEAKKDGQQ